MNTYHKIQSLWKRDPETHKIQFNSLTCPEFAYLFNLDWIHTEKVDGTNIRVIWDGEKVTIKGKTDRANLRTDLVQAITDLLPAEKFNGFNPCTLYGEGYGPKIQGGGKYRDTPGFVLFDVWEEGVWYNRPDIVSVAQDLGIDYVPVVDICPLGAMIDRVRQGLDSDWGQFLAEGVVSIPKVPVRGMFGQRIITKIKRSHFA